MAAGLFALALVARGGCRPTTRVASFNIRMFPEPSTDLAAVARTIAELNADILGVQEIAAEAPLAAVLRVASEQAGRDYRSILSRCRSQQWRITNGLVWDAARWRLVEQRDYPELLPDRGGDCGSTQPGLLGVFERESGDRIAVLSVHLQPFARNFAMRREQWRRVIAIQRAVAAELDITVLAVGDYNSTGFSGQPPEEPDFVRGVVQDAGLQLLSGELPCTEYYRPRADGDYLPSLLDHVVASDGEWKQATVHGLCERLACRTTAPSAMDPDYFRVSDHCPVSVDGTP